MVITWWIIHQAIGYSPPMLLSSLIPPVENEISQEQNNKNTKGWSPSTTFHQVPPKMRSTQFALGLVTLPLQEFTSLIIKDYRRFRPDNHKNMIMRPDF